VAFVVSRVSPPDPLQAHRPDAHWQATDEAGRIAARVSAWWSNVPALPGHRPGVLGHFSADHADAARSVLDAACAELRARGCDLAIGPMDGTTWRSYRLIVERGEAPPFFLEPDHPQAWPDWWRAAGFDVLARYYSTFNPLSDEPDPRSPRLEEKMRAAGVTIRPLDPSRFEQELEGIYELSLASFADNYLYTPIGRAEFLGLYRAIQPVVRPDFVLVAEHESACVGFVFAVPDLLQVRRNGATDAIVVKTLAVRPGRAFAGLGALLLERLRAAARAAGFRHAIHALMHEANCSRNCATPGFRTLRTYALFARGLV
jgi:L-amino acid N-acyltransferase YncA